MMNPTAGLNLVLVSGILCGLLLCQGCTDRSVTETPVVTSPTFILPDISQTSSGQYDLPWAGIWALSGGDYSRITLSQKGNEIAGTTDGISMYGTTTDTPPRLTGTWKSGDGREGWFWFDMSADMRTFHGEWYGPGTFSEINGTRA